MCFLFLTTNSEALTETSLEGNKIIISLFVRESVASSPLFVYLAKSL